MGTVFNLLISPLTHEFMIHALLMSLAIAFVCSIFSCFLVLKGWSLMGDAISHSVLPGLILAYILKIPLIIGAFGSGFLTIFIIGYVKNNSRLKEDTTMGIIFTFMFALGLVILGKIETELHLMHILFGNMLGILKVDLMISLLISSICSIILILKKKDFLLYCFDSVFIKSIGFSTKNLHYGLLALLSLSIISSMKAVGILLVISFLIAPGAIGYLLCKSFNTMLMISIITSVISCLFGTIISYHLDVATAPLIVLIMAGVFIFALTFNKILFKLNPYK
tara:strand:+ start:122 stop:961 length:840 start_codon:yes stop_codon:yes gene_type:complete